MERHQIPLEDSLTKKIRGELVLKSRDRTYDEFCEKEELGGMVTSRLK